jgi:hypothetical protein
MLAAAATKAIAHGASKVPGLKRLPVLKLLSIGEIVLLARTHLTKLDRAERARFITLMRKGRGRSRNLTAGERAELAGLVAKADPRLFAGLVADKLSPVPLPRRIVRGKRKR